MRCADQFGHYELNSFPGCNQLCVSNHAFIEPLSRGRGLGQKQHENRLKAASALDYDAIICTVRADNAIEKHILMKNEWKYCGSFHNKESQHEVEIWFRSLKDSEYNSFAKESVK